MTAHDTVPDIGNASACATPSRALPDDQRRALVLAIYAGKTAREISELDRVPVGTVKTRIRAAMLKLRNTLGVEHEL